MASRLNRIAAAIGLVAGGLGTWALLRAASPSVTPVDREMTFDVLMRTPIVQDTRPEWVKRLDAATYAEWYRRRHHCSDAVLGAGPVCPGCKHPLPDSHIEVTEGYAWCEADMAAATAAGDDPRSVGPCY